jgi:hypothetical protein
MASWYFGTNPSGEPMYNPGTGRTFDGVMFDGVVNRNSGAESTIHGLLSMLALDAHPEVRAQALELTAVEVRTWHFTLGLAGLALVASFLHGRRWHSRSPRHLLAVFAVPVVVLVQDVVFLVLSEDPDYLFWTMRELATVAGAVCGWALASLVRSRSR